ncbi:MAG: DUF1697 domain-containing protein [Tannerellaceae bacterium]|jgi:uncharacterized protein (DUF1697 family)|nr:DUF1697 domain-containing protein [Tannerellaceae bacterium]
MEYLVLLRGINVGGNNIIRMDDLKRMFTNMGFTAVTTYIQSGNIIFKCMEKSKTKLKDEIEMTLLEKVKNKISIAILTLNDMRQIIACKPEGFGDDKEKYKYDVVFLLEPLKTNDAIKAFNPKEGVDKIDEGKNVLYISRLTAQITKSRFTKIIGTKAYQNMTIRNWNTTQRLYTLMEAESDKYHKVEESADGRI